MLQSQGCDSTCPRRSDIGAVHHGKRPAAIRVIEDHRRMNPGEIRAQSRPVGRPFHPADRHLPTHIGGKGIAGLVLAIRCHVEGGFRNEKCLAPVKQPECLLHDFYCLLQAADLCLGHIRLGKPNEFTHTFIYPSRFGFKSAGSGLT